ncbi:MAG: hypothetical protein J5493_05680 [Lachnospiraceae bacterium]|nr:hypothetical protein [Lachnospiraceae bacterium]
MKKLIIAMLALFFIVPAGIHVMAEREYLPPYPPADECDEQTWNDLYAQPDIPPHGTLQQGCVLYKGTIFWESGHTISAEMLPSRYVEVGKIGKINNLDLPTEELCGARWPSGLRVYADPAEEQIEGETVIYVESLGGVGKGDEPVKDFVICYISEYLESCYKNEPFLTWHKEYLAAHPDENQ